MEREHVAKDEIGYLTNFFIARFPLFRARKQGEVFAEREVSIVVPSDVPPSPA